MVQERLTLKHKNTSKWAKRALKRGINVRDDATKEALEEQLRLGQQLRQKVPSSSPRGGGCIRLCSIRYFWLYKH